MAHPLYHHAMRLVGRPVYAHHLNGTVFQGILYSVTADGVYLLNCRPARLASSQEEDTDPDFASGESITDVTHVYAPGAYLAFGALAGFTAGALAGRFWW